MFSPQELEILAQYDPTFMSPDPYTGAYYPHLYETGGAFGKHFTPASMEEVGALEQIRGILDSKVALVAVGVGIGYLLRGLVRR